MIHVLAGYPVDLPVESLFKVVQSLVQLNYESGVNMNFVFYTSETQNRAFFSYMSVCVCVCGD